jgi:RNA polymerase sigma-70 factor (ECF subfamily)
MADSPPLDLDGVLRRARARWPEVTFPLVAFASAAPSVVYPEELCLALACAAGDAAAMAVFEAEFLPEAISGPVRLSSVPGFAAEVAQALRVRLFVAGSERPALIGDYDGSASLLTWTRAVARRCALEELRARKAPISDPEGLSRLISAGTPEASLAQDRLRDDFRVALGAAVGSLTARDRSMLRRHLNEGIPIEGLARAYGVHRSSIVRWLAMARATVQERTRQHLARMLGHTEEEVDSLLRAARSRLDIDISSVFRSQTPIPK